MEVTEHKKRQRHFDRVTLTEENFTKVDTWLADLKLSNQGISISHIDLVNWVLISAPEHLTNIEKDELKSLFFDELKFLKELLANAKHAKASGEKVELANLLTKDTSKRKYRHRKSKPTCTEDSTPTPIIE